jgi:hypothetical protein
MAADARRQRASSETLHRRLDRLSTCRWLIGPLRLPARLHAASLAKGRSPREGLIPRMAG